MSEQANRKTYKAGDDPSTWEHSETGWYMINLVGYEVLMIVWLYSPNGLIKLTDIFCLVKHKTKSDLLLVCAHCTFHTCVNADMYVTFNGLCILRTTKEGK